MPRDNISLRKLATPKQIRLPNGRAFTARYGRINRGTLAPTNMKIRRTYRRSIGPRRQRLRTKTKLNKELVLRLNRR